MADPTYLTRVKIFGPEQSLPIVSINIKQTACTFPVVKGIRVKKFGSGRVSHLGFGLGFGKFPPKNAIFSLQVK